MGGKKSNEWRKEGENRGLREGWERKNWCEIEEKRGKKEKQMQEKGTIKEG